MGSRVAELGVRTVTVILVIALEYYWRSLAGHEGYSEWDQVEALEFFWGYPVQSRMSTCLRPIHIYNSSNNLPYKAMNR